MRSALTADSATMFSFLLAFAVAFTLTPFVKRLAYKIGAVDVPKDSRRKPYRILFQLYFNVSFSILTLIYNNVIVFVHISIIITRSYAYRIDSSLIYILCDWILTVLF